jgi:hypothetical protein
MRIACIVTLAAAVVSSGYGASLSFVNTADFGTTFVYRGSVENNQEIRSGDYFAIYEFPGLVDVSVDSDFGPWYREPVRLYGPSDPPTSTSNKPGSLRMARR